MNFLPLLMAVAETEENRKSNVGNWKKKKKHRSRDQKNKNCGTSLVIQWLRLCASNAGGMDSVPPWGTKIPHAVQHDQINNMK